MKYKRREKPLESFESICNRNGIFFDKTKSYTPVKLIREDGSYCFFDERYNPFTNPDKTQSHSSLVLTDQLQLTKSASKDENEFYQIFESQKIKNRIVMDESSDTFLCNFSYQIKIDSDCINEDKNVSTSKGISLSVA